MFSFLSFSINVFLLLAFYTVALENITEFDKNYHKGRTKHKIAKVSTFF